MSFSRKKQKFDRFFNRLDRPVEESRPDRQPNRPVDPTGAGQSDRFPSLVRSTQILNIPCGTVILAHSYPG